MIILLVSIAVRTKDCRGARDASETRSKPVLPVNKEVSSFVFLYKLVDAIEMACNIGIWSVKNWNMKVTKLRLGHVFEEIGESVCKGKRGERREALTLSKGVNSKSIQLITCVIPLLESCSQFTADPMEPAFRRAYRCTGCP